MPPSEPVFSRDIAEPKNTTGEDVLLVVVLIILATMIAGVWFAKPEHQQRGELRIERPLGQPVKP
jgi:hypothetical protein